MKRVTRKRSASTGRFLWLVITLGCVALVVMLSHPFTVVSIKAEREAQERQGNDFNAKRYVGGIWSDDVLPRLKATAKPMPVLIAAIDNGMRAAGKTYGRLSGEGAPWTFVASGEGVVTRIDTTSRAEMVTLTVNADKGPVEIKMQIGPVVYGTDIRDALPTITFNDFVDQIAFAQVGRALTERAFADIRPQLVKIKQGAHIRFLGVFNLSDATEPIILTPVAISLADGQMQ